MKRFFNIINLICDFSNKRVQFAVVEFLFWATFAANSFNVVFLKEKGYNNTTIGFIMSIVALGNIFSKPFWGIVSDKIRSIKKTYIFCFTVSAILYVLFPFNNRVLSMCIIMLLYNFFSSPLNPLLDSWIMKGIYNSENISYGSLRLWGSIGYAIMTYIYGKLVHNISVYIIFPTCFITALFTIIFSLSIKNETINSPLALREMKLNKLFKNYYYVTFILFAFFINIPNIVSTTFLPNLVEKLGGSKEQLGQMFSIRALSEIPIFFFGGYLINRFGAIRLIIFASVIYLLQQLVYLLAVRPWHAILGHIMGGPAYSLFLLGMIYYIYILTPDELKATGQTIVNSFSMGLSSVIGNYLGGLLIDNFGLHLLYIIGFINNFIILGLFILSIMLRKQLRSYKMETTGSSD